jgi:hypothetical protein
MTLAVVHDMLPLITPLFKGGKDHLQGKFWLALCAHCKYFVLLMQHEVSVAQLLRMQDLMEEVHWRIADCWPR